MKKLRDSPYADAKTKTARLQQRAYIRVNSTLLVNAKLVSVYFCFYLLIGVEFPSSNNSLQNTVIYLCFAHSFIRKECKIFSKRPG